MRDTRAGARSRAGRASRALVGFAAAGCVLGLSAPARAQQVTIYLNGYGTQVNQPPPPPSQPTQAPSGYGALQGRAALAQMAAYGQYLQYLTILNYQSTHGGASPPGTDVAQYFTNGAAATTVPGAGQPGAAYFTNGSEATVAPVAPASPPAPPAAPVAAAPSPWVVVYPPAPAAPASAAPVVAPPPAPVAAAGPPPDPPLAMSFDDWLASMGLGPDSETPTLTSAEVVAPPLAEPAAAAFEVRHRVSTIAREKSRARLAPDGGGGWATAMTGAFAAGLLLGGVAMMRLRDRMRRASALDAPSSPPPSSSPPSSRAMSTPSSRARSPSSPPSAPPPSSRAT